MGPSTALLSAALLSAALPIPMSSPRHPSPFLPITKKTIGVSASLLSVQQVPKPPALRRRRSVSLAALGNAVRHVASQHPCYAAPEHNGCAWYEVGRTAPPKCSISYHQRISQLRCAHVSCCVAPGCPSLHRGRSMLQHVRPALPTWCNVSPRASSLSRRVAMLDVLPWVGVRGRRPE